MKEVKKSSQSLKVVDAVVSVNKLAVVYEAPTAILGNSRWNEHV